MQLLEDLAAVGDQELAALLRGLEAGIASYYAQDDISYKHSIMYHNLITHNNIQFCITIT